MCGCCGRNATGSELRKNGIPTDDLSLIETFPFKHIIAAKDFMQKELEDEYDTNAEFKSIIDKWMRFSAQLAYGFNNLGDAAAVDGVVIAQAATVCIER